MGAAQTNKGYAQVNGGKLYYEVAGEGHPLVLVHGGIFDSRMWDDQFNVFTQHYRVIRYDMRSFGKSDLPTEPFSMQEDLYSLLKFLEIEKTYVLGLSLGGAVAIDFTLVHPETIDALIVASSALGGHQFSEENMALINEVDAAVEGGDVARGVELENKLWIDGPERSPEQVNAHVRERVREMNTHNYELILGKDLPSLIGSEPSAISRLAEIHTPTLVVVGDKDVHDMMRISDLLANGIAGAKKVVVPDVAHALNMEKPEEFNRIVLDFLGAL